MWLEVGQISAHHLNTPVGCALFPVGISLSLEELGCGQAMVFFPNLLSGSAELVPSFIPQVFLTPVQSATTCHHKMDNGKSPPQSCSQVGPRGTYTQEQGEKNVLRKKQTQICSDKTRNGNGVFLFSSTERRFWPLWLILETWLRLSGSVVCLDSICSVNWSQIYENTFTQPTNPTVK